MAKRSKMPTDVNQRGAAIVAFATGQTEPEPEKDPAAVALGRKGGAARAASLTPERRAEIARRAAASRRSSADDA